MNFEYFYLLPYFKICTQCFSKEKIFIQFFAYKKLPSHSNSDHELSKNLDTKEK